MVIIAGVAWFVNRGTAEIGGSNLPACPGPWLVVTAAVANKDM